MNVTLGHKILSLPFLFPFLRIGLCIFLFFPFSATAQPSLSSCNELATRFKSAIQQKDTSLARLHFKELYACYPEGLGLAATEAEALLAGNYYSSSQRSFTPEKLDSLVRVYDAAIWSERADAFDWQVRKAMLSLNYRKHFNTGTLLNLRACFLASPEKCPLYIVESLVEISFESFQQKKKELHDLLVIWADVDKALSRRYIIQRKERAEITEVYERMQVWIDTLLPPCSKKKKQEKFSHSYNLPGHQEIREELTLNYLHKCNKGPELGRALSLTVEQMKDPYWLRIAASISDEPERQLTLLEKAIEFESHPMMKAADHLKKAKALESLAKFREARRSIETAIELAPRWGEPYMAMSDLLVMSSFVCEDFTAFDRKAVFWAAMDYVSAGQSADPGYHEVASKRMFELKVQAPSRKEALFRGLKHGDTYPIRCWLEIITTVKTF